MPPTPTWVPYGLAVALYLSLAGVAAGAGLVAAWTVLTGRLRTGRRAGLVAAGAIAAGALFLVADLERPDRFWLILASFNPTSVIAWGSRIIALFGLAAGALVLALPPPSGRTRGSTPARTETGAVVRGLAAALGILALAVALYPGLVLDQAAARPLWQSPWLAPLLAVSALHMGLGALYGLGLAADPVGPQSAQVPRLEGILLGAQAVLAVLWLTSVRDDAPDGVARLLTGSVDPWIALGFWAGFVAVGLVVPAVAAWSTRGRPDRRTPWRALALGAAPVAGGVALRLALVFGGQGAIAFT